MTEICATARHRGHHYFPQACHYFPHAESDHGILREPSARGRSFSHTERHLQAVWYDPKWRPLEFAGSRGEIIRVESAGSWNLNAGPDFIGATLIVGPDNRRISGDVEIHIFPADWKRHGHHADVRYQNVCLHLTYFEGQLPENELPPGTIQAALRPVLKRDPAFSFEHVDLTAYPYAGRADIPPCRAVLDTWPAAWRSHLLDAAGQERLRRKSERFADAIAEKGIDQTLYESIMNVLGYRHNKTAFHALAIRLPVDVLTSLSEGQPDRAFAMLAGMSGLLPKEMKDAWDDETKSMVRLWWDIWWRNRHHVSTPMTREAWQLHGLRPLNHPLRRMMAAAMLFAKKVDGINIIERWISEPVRDLTVRMHGDFNYSKTGYWSLKTSLGCEKLPEAASLLGMDRILAMALNVVVPMAAACGYDPDRVNGLLADIPPEPNNRVIKETGFYLFGRDAPSAMLKSSTRRQGLMQIFHDYCMNDRSQCRNCTFPIRLKEMGSMQA
ncbi:MAG TPA: DUF2851 family protein [Kiritimatiellia bacterium]|nr:DUF2851 family protein [Kiritimatiellia bacterium]